MQVQMIRGRFEVSEPLYDRAADGYGIRVTDHSPSASRKSFWATSGHTKDGAPLDVCVKKS